VRCRPQHRKKTLLARCPNLVEEAHGIAEGAGLSYGKVLLLNVGYDAKGDALNERSNKEEAPC